jgi:hypothetical protein
MIWQSEIISEGPELAQCHGMAAVKGQATV